MVASFKESQLIGRENEKADIIKLISNEDSQKLEVISVYGMGGLGKTTLAKDVYQSQELSGMFQKRACLTITRPFDPEEILRSLAMQLDAENLGNTWTGQSLAGLFEGNKYLIVLDDLSSTHEWDTIMQHFPTTETASRIIVTTRVEKIAKHCSKNLENLYKLKALGYKGSCDLFTEKVLKVQYFSAKHLKYNIMLDFPLEFPPPLPECYDGLVLIGITFIGILLGFCW